MKLNDLESKFFGRILNVELDVPVLATLEYEENTFGIIVVPSIDSYGHFRLNYYNAPPYEPETQYDESGMGTKGWSESEMLGTHPVLERAWLNSDPVTVQLQTSQMLFEPQIKPKLDAKVLYAGSGHRGALRLDRNQVMVQKSSLTKAEFCIVGFPDFETPEKQWSSIAGIGEMERGMLGDVASKLEDGAKIKIHPSPHHIVLDSSDGWNITFTKDERQTRDLVSHTGLVKRSDGSEYGTNELGDVLQGLKYFFAFSAGVYCHPTVVIGYDSQNQLVWGEVGQFETDRHHPVNWFRNANSDPFGTYLEELFPRFWQKWRQKKSEVIAVIECYVHSNAMRKAGVPNDAVAKSYAGLEILASLMLGKTIGKRSHKEIYKVLSEHEIPHSCLNSSETPVITRLLKDLNVNEAKGPHLLNTVRNYVAHPLDRNTPAEVKEEYLNYLDAYPMHYVYLHDLSQFYLEYAFLKFFGYKTNDYRQLLETMHKPR